MHAKAKRRYASTAPKICTIKIQLRALLGFRVVHVTLQTARHPRQHCYPPAKKWASQIDIPSFCPPWHTVVSCIQAAVCAAAPPLPRVASPAKIQSAEVVKSAAGGNSQPCKSSGVSSNMLTTPMTVKDKMVPCIQASWHNPLLHKLNGLSRERSTMQGCAQVWPGQRHTITLLP